MMQQIALDDIAAANTHIAVESHDALADFLASLDADAWNGPTACTKWTVRDLAEHVAGVATIFSGSARQGVADDGAPPPWMREIPAPADLDRLAPGAKVVAYARRLGLDTSTPADLIDTMRAGVRDFQRTIATAGLEELQQPATVPFGTFPVFMLTNMLAIEGAVHHWDARARRESGATIWSQWAQPLAFSVNNWMPYLASAEGAAGASGVYLLQVGEGIGPVSVVVQGGQVKGEHGEVGEPDVVVHLTPDQYIRLTFGRLDVRREHVADSLRTDVDLERAARLNQIFQGI